MHFQTNEEVADYVNLFVSILICFPEVGTIKYDRDSDDLYFNFILKNVDDTTRRAIDYRLLNIEQALRQYHRMEKTDHYDYQVKVHHLERHSVIEVKRDIQTVTRAEISFLVELYRTEFSEHLLMEIVDNDGVPDSEFYSGECIAAPAAPIIGTKRITFDEKSIGNRIVVCREAGKVLVFSNHR